MTWRRHVVAILLVFWLAVGVAWGWDAVIFVGFFVFIAGATVLRAVRRSDRSSDGAASTTTIC